MFNSDHIIKTSIEAIRLGIPSQFANHFVGQTAGYCVTQTCESCGETMQIHNDARWRFETVRVIRCQTCIDHLISRGYSDFDAKYCM